MTVTATLDFQLRDNSTQTLGDQRLWLSGEFPGDAIQVGEYQRLSYVTDLDNNSLFSLQNAEFESDTTAILNESGDLPDTIVGLPIPNENCQLCIHILSDTPIILSNVRFYAYDGILDSNPFRGIDFKAAEGEISTSWQAANSSGVPLHLTSYGLTSDPDTEFRYYIAVTAAPSGTGRKQGKLKCVFDYSEP